jgi:uncharacterized membrane protein
MGLIKYILKETDGTLNNAVKALLIGFIFGVVGYFLSTEIIGTSTIWDSTEAGLKFTTIYPTEEALTLGIIVFIVTSGGLFLKYNNKKK